MRVRVDSVGCRLNIGEAEEIARCLAGWGHRIVGPGELADLCIFNTCAVTHVAARKSRKFIRQLRRANPGATVVVTGCYAELARHQVEALGVDLVVGNRHKEQLLRLLEEAGLLRDADPVPAPDAVPFAPLADAAEFSPPGNGHGRTRAFVKVQDGCDHRCTFCIVTVARGDARSRPQSEVIAAIGNLVKLGYREAVLSGVHLGSYGHDRGDRDGLRRLVRAILRDTEIPRLRLSSLEPWDLDGDFFELWEDPRLLAHLHLPLQSGCDATLRRMARRTTQAQFADLVGRARAAIPDLAVTTDIIVGFPGETEGEFDDSIAFVEQMGFAKLHIFRHSRGQGTAAATMPKQVEPGVARERSRRMHALGCELEGNFRRGYLGRTMPVLWETREPGANGWAWSGLTSNYLRVVAEAGSRIDLTNSVTDARLVAEVPGALWAETPHSSVGPEP